MAKERGFAVVSGTNTVVARIMENGTVRFGEDMAVTGAYSGTLVLNLPSGQGDNRVVQVDSSNSASLAQLSASQIALNAGMPDFGGSTSVSGALVYLSSSISSLDAGANLDVSASNGSGSITFATEVFSIVGTANQTVTSYDEGTSTLTVSLTQNVTVTGSLTASGISSSAELQVGTSAVIGGPLTVNSGISVFNGDLQVTGNLYVSGSTVTIDAQNLRIKDPIILLGSSSATDPNATPDGDRGLIFGQSGSGQFVSGGVPAFGWDSSDGVFRLGATLNDATDTTLTIVPSSGTLELGTLSASNVTTNDLTVNGTLTVANSDITISGTVGEIEVSGTGLSTLFQTITLGTATTITIGLPDNVSISDNLTVGKDLVVSGNTTLGTNQLDTITVVGNLRHPIFTVSGANNVPTFPIVPDEYVQNPAIYTGFSFYLTSSAAATNGITPGSGSILTVGNKWYFNENGEWHPSFFYSV